ncbi:D-alanyl-D-alanine carboxypeptidase family protein [Shinella granuli]|uniref:serine-type D-Ala-D-Ala carboxypeptidase n=1 Tax=Shinella granuli TaxID=323621 RepID=A0A4R2CKX8_SHIGR|nr:D-alanyl-D-alanine carboxypeptidase family protein [Shinella granuli]TCN40642.1 D-alanyl-D-alanine carboxypeptidase (penicillin-binding protein 5/6) [Shinella granuli]
MHRRLFAALVLLLSVASLAFAQSAAPQAGFDVKAKQVYLIEAETGTVLFARAEDEAVPAASLAKLMTMASVFKALAAGETTLDTTYPVTEHAWRTGGAPSRTSTMFAALKSTPRVEDLIRGVTVQFANDACIILAEGLAGSETAFAERMTTEARALGLENATFANATGLPNPGNTVTMREMVALARHLQTTYPQHMGYYLEPEFEWNKIKQRNRNPLLALNIGVTGFVTGFSEEGGYSIVAAVNRDGKHLVLAMGGMENDKTRIDESRRIIEWALSSFERRTLFKEGEAIADASVYGGDASTVPLVAGEQVDVFLPKDNSQRLVARVVYNWPVRAPVTPGQAVGTLKIWNDKQLLREVPVETAGTVGVGTLRARALDALIELFFFWI